MTRAVHIGSHGSHRNAEDVGDLGVRITFRVEQDHRESLAIGQLREGVEQPLRPLAARGELVRRLAPVDRSFVERLGAANRAAPAAIDGGIGDDAHQPRTEGSSRVIARQLRERGDERVLRRVVGVVGIAQERPRDATRLGRVPLDQGPEGVAVAGDGALG